LNSAGVIHLRRSTSMRRDQYSTPPKPESEMIEKAMKSSRTVGEDTGRGSASDVDRDMIRHPKPRPRRRPNDFGGGAHGAHAQRLGPNSGVVARTRSFFINLPRLY
jgi:hypothetical protein